MRWATVVTGDLPEHGYQVRVVPAERQVLAGPGQKARHPHRRDTGQLGTGRVELQVPSVGELLGQGDTEFIAQGIDQDIGDTATAFMQFRGHQTVKHIRVGQPSAGRPAAHFQMLGKEDLYRSRQTTVARPCLLNHPGHDLLRLDGIADGLLKLAL